MAPLDAMPGSPLPYPEKHPEDLRDTTRGFYKLFYQVDLTDAQLDVLLSAAMPVNTEKPR